MDNVYVYLVDLPGPVNEAVTPCEDGYTIYIDPRQSDDGIHRSYDHAIGHIRERDFEKEDVQEIEGNAHRNK